MRVLLDTHVLLWGIDRPERLSTRARQILEHRDSRLAWSAVGTVEIAIKVARRSLRLQEPLEAFIRRHQELLGFEHLPVEHRHALAVADLPLHHGDPFDRLLVAQAKVEGIPLVTSDTLLRKYGIEVIW